MRVPCAVCIACAVFACVCVSHVCAAYVRVPCICMSLLLCSNYYLRSLLINPLAILYWFWIGFCIGLRIIHRPCGFIGCCVDFLNVVRIIPTIMWILWILCGFYYRICGLFSTCADFSMSVWIIITWFANRKIEKRWNFSISISGLIDLWLKLAKLIRTRVE